MGARFVSFEGGTFEVRGFGGGGTKTTRGEGVCNAASDAEFRCEMIGFRLLVSMQESFNIRPRAKTPSRSPRVALASARTSSRNASDSAPASTTEPCALAAASRFAISASASATSTALSARTWRVCCSSSLVSMDCAVTILLVIASST